MRRVSIAMMWALFGISIAFASDDPGAVRGARPAAQFLLAQSNSCARACQDAAKSCLAKIEPGCTSRGCVNERNGCTSDYNDCTKKCGN